jgi:hypothetical protein
VVRILIPLLLQNNNKYYFRINDLKGVKLIEECNFKSKIRHRDSPGCRLTPPEVVCPGENKCILFQIYKNVENMEEK